MSQENAQAQHPQLRHPEGVVPDSDAQALVAYLKLLAKVFREGSVPGEGSSTSPVIAWMHVLEEETGARPLWEVMFQLMCHPVPQVSHPTLAALSYFGICASCSGAAAQLPAHTTQLLSGLSLARICEN